MSVLKHLSRRRFATGGSSDTRFQIPERLTGDLIGMSDPRTLISDPTAATATPGRTYHPLDDADYYSYGQTGGEHTFFTGNLPVSPLQPNNLPTGGRGGSSSSGGGAGGVLSAITQLVGTAKNAGQLANMAGIDNGYTDAMKNPVQAARDAYGRYQLNNDVGSGQYANDVLSDAGFGNNYKTPELDLSGALGAAGAGASALGAASAAVPAGSVTITDLAGNALVGSSGAGAAGAAGSAGAAGAGSSAASAGAGSASSGLGATLASSGIATALPIAAIGWAIADAANAKGDIKSGATTDFLKSLTSSGYLKLLDPRTQTYQLSDGRTVRADQGARNVSEYLRKGDRANAQKAFEEWVNGAKGGHARGGRSLATGVPGALHYAAQDPKFNGSVRGAGTGRSDEIPARLSDGEYVMDAETVAMLGDGSTDAGARKLDELRANLRKHKGRNLAKGKFSDNAKDPQEYIR